MSPHHRQHLLPVFWIVAILMAVRWYLIVVLIFISPMITGVERNMCLLAMHISSLKKCLFKASPLFSFELSCLVVEFRKFSI